MGENEDKLKYLGDLLKSSLLPELVQDIGIEPIESKHFDTFRQSLEVTLVQVFDIIHHNEDILYNTEKETLLIRQDFILLLCEQTALRTLFQIKNKLLMDNISHLINKHFMKMINNDREKLLNSLFLYYKERLRTTCWKKHLGAVHGFDRFCELYFRENKNELSSELATFLLSVGLLLEEFYDPIYREMGFKVLNIILTAMPIQKIEDMNVQNLIYETAFRDIPKLTSKEGTIVIWQCLLKCLEIFQIKDISKWNKIDDLMLNLFQRITFESKTETCIELFLIIPKLCLVGIENESNKLNFSTYQKDISVFRKKCKDLYCPSAYRWVKKMLELFVAESNRLLGNASTALQMLSVFHYCFLVCIFSVPAKITQPHFLEFLQKFPLILMEVLNVNKNDKILKMSVKDFFETFLIYIQEEEEGDIALQRCTEFESYREALSKLLCSEIFD